MPKITNQSGKYEFKYLNSLEYYFTKNQFDGFSVPVYLQLQYIFNMTCTNTFVCDRARYWSPFYMGFYP